MKFRTSYPKEMRDKAKKLEHGLFTLDIVRPGGARTHYQGYVDEELGETLDKFMETLMRLSSTRSSS